MAAIGMRKITTAQISIFFTFFFIIVATGITVTLSISSYLPFGDFRGITLSIIAILTSYATAFLCYRLFMWATPLNEGEILPGSQQESIYHIYLLFFLILFYPVTRCGAVPVPVMRIVYLLLGAKLGDNTYSAGIILDPRFVEVGSHSLIGQNALIVPHAIENEKLSHTRIHIGDNVTIGAQATVLAGVVIEDNALVATGAVVTKGTHIKAGEVWGGVPAKCLQKPAV